MPEYLAPGVFIEEIERGPRPIEGVATSTAAFLGETERGRTKPRLVTSFNEYRRHFGSAFSEGKYMPDALSGFFDNGGRRAYVCRIVGANAAAATRTVSGLKIDAIGPGAWGDRVFVKLVGSTTTTGPNKDPVGFRLQVAYWQTPTSDGQYPDPFDRTQPRRLPLPTMTEDFDNLVFDDRTSPDFFEKRLEDNSALVAVSTAAPGPIATLPTGTFGPLAGGADGTAPTVVDFKGENTDSNLRAGLSALELDEFREVALVTAPAAPNDVVDAVRTHCERSKFRFAVIDSARNLADANEIDPRSDFDTSYAGFYYPWIYTADLQSGARRLVPPSGHVLLRPHRHRPRRLEGSGERRAARRL
jgi:phage tail sheath protein FI